MLTHDHIPFLCVKKIGFKYIIFQCIQNMTFQHVKKVWFYIALKIEYLFLHFYIKKFHLFVLNQLHFFCKNWFLVQKIRTYLKHNYITLHCVKNIIFFAYFCVLKIWHFNVLNIKQSKLYIALNILQYLRHYVEKKASHFTFLY